jgi:hypothetical protein
MNVPGSYSYLLIDFDRPIPPDPCSSILTGNLYPWKTGASSLIVWSDLLSFFDASWHVSYDDL